VSRVISGDPLQLLKQKYMQATSHWLLRELVRIRSPAFVENRTIAGAHLYPATLPSEIDLSP